MEGRWEKVDKRNASQLDESDRRGCYLLKSFIFYLIFEIVYRYLTFKKYILKER